MTDEPFRIESEITAESSREPLQAALRMVSAGYGGQATYKSIGSELATAVFAGLDLDHVSDDDLQALVDRVVHAGYGLAIVAVRVLRELEEATGEDGQDVLRRIEDEHDEAWSGP